MAGFHGWFSVGMVAGVGAGAAALLIGIPPLVHAAIVIVLAVGVLSPGLPAKSSPLVEALAGRPWAVVTSASRSLAEDRLKAAGLWRGMPLIGADDVALGKPSPEGYLLAARMLGVPPQACVVIEDAPAGVTAGIRAGMTIVGVATTHPASALDTPQVIPDLSAVTVLSGPAGAIRLGIASWREESNRDGKGARTLFRSSLLKKGS